MRRHRGRYPFSVIKCTSIRWYHEIIRKYAKGVTGQSPGWSEAVSEAEPWYETSSNIRSFEMNNL